MLKKKTAATIEERLNGAHATAEAATSVVETIALDLEIAVAEKQAIIEDIDAETAAIYARVDQLDDLRYEALSAITANTAKADKIRALVSA